MKKKRLFGLGSSKRGNLKRRATNAARNRRRIQLESLEDRRLLTLLGVNPEFPIISANSTGVVSYDAGTNAFVADAVPLIFTPSFFASDVLIQGPKSFDLQFSVDESGNFSGGVSGDDFVVTGSIDLNGDTVPDFDGVLLTGEVSQFGFLNSASTSSDDYDLRLTVTGGELASTYFAGKDIGLLINSENSTFANNFNIDFGGGNKSVFGPIEPLAKLGNYVWVDTNQNGLQDDGNTGVNDVTVYLYEDDGDGIAEPGGDDGGPVATTVTADLDGAPGYYLFPNLDPGDYFVVFDPSTLPVGFEFTTQDAGTDDAVDSDADTTTGIAAVTTLDAGESDLTWDAGIFQTAIPLFPAIDIEKCVEHTVVGPGEMHVLDFDDLASGTVVDDEYSSLGVTISVQNDNSSHPDKAIVFDSATPTGEDNDLKTPGYHGTNTAALGNVLIIAEDDVDANNDQLVDDPDDEASGGTITFTFDDAVRIDQIDLLDVDSSEVGGSVVTVNTANGSQTFNIAALGDNSFQTININVDDVTSLSVNFISSGAITGLKFTKPSESLECDDADVGPGPSFNVGDSVTFNYTVTNPGEVDLKIVEVSDDNATPGNTSDDFNPEPVLVGIYNIGDTDQDGELDLTEAWQYSYTITATVAGQFTNISDVLGNPVDNPDVDVVDDDPANYVVVGDPGIAIEKFTNGVDAENESQAAEIAAGDTVTWTYEVTNTGEVAFTAAEISLVDDNGTPTVSTDDFGIGLEYNGSEIVYSSGDGGDWILSPGETWTYTATGTALALPGGTVGPAITFDFAGSSSTDGTDGNTRSYSAGGVDVDVRAFSRDKSNGTWAPAYLGSYGGGLGVTDSSEGSGGSNMHTVDNVGRDNYVLFEYSEQVVVDAAYLGYVVDDSDLTIWIGNSAVPLTGLSDAVLTSLGFTEVNLTNSSSARWADLNAGEVAGNVLVIAAKTGDSTPEDRFKIEHVKVHRTASGCYENIAVVTAGGVSDSDASYYCNTEPGDPGIAIEKFTNGHDADTAATAVEIATGETITWTYEVTNTGTTDFNLADIVVTDDNGTAQTGDDLSTVADGDVEITLTDQGDNDGVLAPGEVWTYTATGTAAQLSGGITGDAITVYLTGSTSTSGTAGNSKTFTSGGVSVEASAYSRDYDGNWAAGYLGAYSSGLGVTDGSEGNGNDGRHRVDNTGRMNYVLFEFSESVVVDQAFLDSVVHDSDITAWIGTIDGTVTLNDAVLDLLAKESNDTGSSSSRWADLNNGQVAGNVLVIAASVDDSTPEDNFKIRKLKFNRTESGVYANVGTVQAGGVSDSDLSHYVNPAQSVASGKIGNYVWNDSNRNGKQDAGESGLSGVTVKLLDVNDAVVATTTTNSDGLYSFSGLDAGQYFVKFIAPQDMVFSPQGQGDHADHGSNANADGTTDKIYLADGETDNTIDAGLYAAAVDLMFEAEDYEWIDSPWQVRSSSSASGGEYIKAPNGTGSYYNTPPSHSKVMYQFDVAAEGNYEISALVRASRSSDNSVWVKVDDQPWIQWHTDLTGSAFEWQGVTDGWDQRATQFHLDAGQHSLQLRVREDGIKLDKFMVSKLSTTTVVIDAMATTTNLDSVAWEVGVDADGNEYLLAANGTGSHYSNLNGDELSYDFSVDQAGEYQMHGLVNALNSSDNSFWISIDGGEWVQWHLSVTNGEWEWQTVSDGSGHEQVSFDLEAGSHTLKIKVREDGTMLDKIVITNDSTLDLDTVA